MDITGKHIHIERSSINSIDQKTTVLVYVFIDISSDIRVLDGVYEIKLDGDFQGHYDPTLLLAVSQKLSTL